MTRQQRTIDIARAIDVMELFDEKVLRLLSSPLAKVSLEQTLKKQRDEDGWTIEYVGPIGDVVDAFLLTFRFFIQRNEAISFDNVQRLYKSLVLEARLKEFSEQCAELNQYLDQQSPFMIGPNAGLTVRDILNLFLYGEFAHANPKKRLLLRAMKTGPAFPILQVGFIEILLQLLTYLKKLAAINRRTLAQVRQAVAALEERKAPSTPHQTKPRR